MAGNKHKGHLQVPIGERTYTLQLTFDAMASIEEATGLDIENALKFEPGKPMLKRLRMVFFNFLHEHHPEVTEKMAGELLLLASVPAIEEALVKATAAAFPQAKKGPDGTAIVTADPPQAPVGTSADSASAQ